MKRVLDYIMWTVKEEGSKERDFRLDLVHPMLMVSWIMEVAELARRSIYHATFHDGASGGVASVYYVGPSGWKKLSGDDVGELHYKYYPVMPSTVEQEMVGVAGA
ncbi:proteasome subunit beta type-5-like [Castanea sativa]|uniref:proteasome subunit beta type-5-like n=1 Tax=Castanea sativa TaxID=21020 RepID=UPI003F64D41B